jgi:hypothetical protein
MPSKGPSGSTTVTQNTNNAPWSAQQPYLQDQFSQALNLFQNNPLLYYPNQTLATPNDAIPASFGSMINAGTDQYNWTSGSGQLQGDAISAADNATQGVWDNPALSYLQNFAGNNPARLETGNLNNVGASVSGSPYPTLTGQVAGRVQGDISPYATGLSSYAQGATSNPYTGLLAGYGGAAANTGSAGAANIAGISDPNIGAAESDLQRTARGDFLGSNPYLAGEYAAASRPMVNAYMTATAPQTDSAYNAAGRLSSGAHDNAVQQIETTLATGLGDLSANLYGQDYANERNLMTSAGTSLGNLGIGSLGTRVGQAATAADTGLRGLSTAGGLAGNAGNLYLGGYGTGGSLLGSALSGTLGADVGAGNLYSDAQSGLVQGANAATGAYGTAGSQDIAGRNSQVLGANSLGNTYNEGVSQALTGAQLTPGLSMLGAGDLGLALSGGQGLTALDQQQINDQMARFYGVQAQPYNELAAFAQNIGGPVGLSGSSATTTPYFTNPVGNLIGGGLGALSLGNGLNTALGSGGFLSGLFGGGGAFGSSLIDAGAATAGALGAGTGAGLSGLPLLSLLGSDRSIKTDIEPIGALPNGLPVYRFRYIGHPGTRLGLMADEVERVNSQAVFLHPMGFKMVDYRAAIGRISDG